MKLLHTSDWHLGACEGDYSLWEDQRHFIDEIGAIAEREKVDAVLLAGDIYDRSVASADAMRLYDYAMQKICLEAKMEAVIIAGNHDSAERLAGCRQLLEKAGLHVVGALEREPSIVSIGNADIYLLPWFTQEKVRGLFPEHKDEIKSLTDAYRIVCDHARTTFDASKRHIALSHSFITNAQISGSDKAAEIASIGSAMQVDADVFDGFDYVALGHIHGPQNVTDHIRYCGTPMAYSFGREEKQEKSVTVLDTETMERKVVALHPLHKRTTLEGTYEELLKGDCPEDIKNGFVRLKVTDVYVGLERIAKLREIYPRCLEIQGKTFEGENASIKMTMEEFQRIENNPAAIFESFCMDVIGEEPDARRMDLFQSCLESEAHS